MVCDLFCNCLIRSIKKISHSPHAQSGKKRKVFFFFFFHVKPECFLLVTSYNSQFYLQKIQQDNIKVKVPSNVYFIYKNKSKLIFYFVQNVKLASIKSCFSVFENIFTTKTLTSRPLHYIFIQHYVFRYHWLKSIRIYFGNTIVSKPISLSSVRFYVCFYF